MAHGDFNSQLSACCLNFRLLNNWDVFHFFGCFFTQSLTPNIAGEQHFDCGGQRHG